MISQTPEEVLTKKATLLSKTELKKEYQTVLLEMKKYVEQNEQVAGLALPQVGISKRAFIAKLDVGDTTYTEVFINPSIVPFDKEKKVGKEGCLSIPGQEFLVERYHGIEVIYQGSNGKAKKLKLKGFNARVVQHEYDHLNGILISEIGTAIQEKETR